MYYGDVVGIGLLYVYLNHPCQRMLKETTINEFEYCIQENLIQMKKTVESMGRYEMDIDPIYFYSVDENGEGYYILKHNFDLEKAKACYLGEVSLDGLVASQQENALNILGLTKVNGKITLKENPIKTKRLTLK